MKECYKNPEATKAAIVDGWLLTGDMARLDADGFIWLVDRKKDLIITGGENIFPVEIEDFLMENPKVQDAAVIGVPDERLGEVAAAVIKVKPGHTLTEQDVLLYCEGLPRLQTPQKDLFRRCPEKSHRQDRKTETEKEIRRHVGKLQDVSFTAEKAGIRRIEFP